MPFLERFQFSEQGIMGEAKVYIICNVPHEEQHGAVIALGRQMVIDHSSGDLHRIKEGAWRVSPTETGSVSVEMNTFPGRN